MPLWPAALLNGMEGSGNLCTTSRRLIPVTAVLLHANRYAGNFEHNKRHGLGIYSYMSGANYEGAFAFDQRHGHGKYTFANGE